MANTEQQAMNIPYSLGDMSNLNCNYGEGTHIYLLKRGGKNKTTPIPFDTGLLCSSGWLEFAMYITLALNLKSSCHSLPSPQVLASQVCAPSYLLFFSKQEDWTLQVLLPPTSVQTVGPSLMPAGTLRNREARTGSVN